MSARTLAFLPVLCLVLASCAGIGGAIEDTSTGVRGLVSSTSTKISGLFDREDEARVLKAAAITSAQPEADQATVRTIQHLLINAGYTPGAADGIYGPKTRAAIIAFQRKMELTPDGLKTLSDRSDTLTELFGRYGLELRIPGEASPVRPETAAEARAPLRLHSAS